MSIEGVWLPIITPFKNGEVDIDSYKKLLKFYIPKGISGLIPLGTTGECPTLSDYEMEKIIDVTVQDVDGKLPIIVGWGGNDTQKVIRKLKIPEKYPIQGILSVCPYYNRPHQEGLKQHFLRIAEATSLDIVIYNIPYRTGVNLRNDSLLELAKQRNIIGVKDSCGDFAQTTQLLLSKPDKFSVLTGEDILYYSTLLLGGNGGILASAHLNTEAFVSIFEHIKNNNHQAALKEWKLLTQFIPLLFKEPNPGPIKYCLEKMSQIDTSELRLPLTDISEQMKKELDGCKAIRRKAHL